jgi:hypothetical protein
MIISQDGKFAVNSFGWPVICILDPQEDNKLTGVTDVTMFLRRPDGTFATGTNGRVLPMPACITDVRGEITWYVVAGDLPHHGAYNLSFEIDFDPDKQLTCSGDFEVTK